MVSYNTGSHSQDMDEDDLSALGAAELADNISESSFEFNPSELLSAPLFDNSDDELERIPSSPELVFHQMEVQHAFSAFDQQLSRVASQGGGEGQTMFLDSNGFPVAQKVNSKRRPIPEDQRPRRIPGLVKQGSSKSSLLSRGARSLEAGAPNSGMGSNAPNQGNNYDSNMDIPIDNFDANSTMDVNMNTSPEDMDVSMSPEAEGLQVPGNDLRSYNEAMEKLCESMKRSAMSRNLVKHLSNRSLQKDGSSRSIGSGTQITHPSSSSRQSSGRSLNVVSRNSSARSLVQQNSGRGLAPQGSVRSLDDNGLGTLSSGPYPSQRRRHAMEAKHRFSPHRGVVRHNSSNAVHNRPRNNNVMNQYDDSGLGLVFDGKNMYS